MTLAAALRDQAGHCAALGSPYTAEILTVIADHLRPGSPLADRLFAWPGDIGPMGASVPLRLAGALHGLVLEGLAPDLAGAYAARLSGPALWAEIARAFEDHAGWIMARIDHAPQTNEIRRSSVLIATGHWLAARYGLPLVLSELGASAGLNLWWDRYALDIAGQRFGPESPVLTLAPDWQGPLPPATPPQIAARAGVDLNPLDPARDRARLLSYIWPDQPDRLTRTRAALDHAASLPNPVARGDAVDWLETRLARPMPGHLHLIFHTIAWQYFPAEAQARGEALIIAAGEEASAEAPLAWLAMESDGQAPGAALTLRLWPGDLVLAMGRFDFHGRWLHWKAC